MRPENQTCIEKQLVEIATTQKSILRRLDELKSENAVLGEKVERIQIELAESRGGKRVALAIAGLAGGSGGAGLMALLLKLFGGGV